MIGRPLIVASIAAVLMSMPVSAAAARTPASGIVASAPAAPRGSVDLGPAPLGARVGVAVTLRYRNDAELSQLAILQSDERSWLYRRWLSNEQFNERYAPTLAQYERTIGVLERNGFTVSQTYSNRTVIDAVGTVESAERLFATSIHRFHEVSGGTAMANVTPAIAPSAMSDAVLAVSGLNTFTRLKATYARVGPLHIKSHSIDDSVGYPLRGPVSSVTGLSGYGPLAFSQGYNFPDQHGAIDGSGRTAGIVIDADFLNSDLKSYLDYFHVTRNSSAIIHRVRVDGGPPPGLASPDSLETTLDVEALISTAPGVNLYVYEFPSFDNLQYVTDAYNKVVSDNLVDSANSSFGGCEDAFETDALAWDQVARQGATKGITFHASTGDYGSDPCFTGYNNVIAPASSPYFAAIGGTAFQVYNHGNYRSETVWNTDDYVATGGGVSDVFPLPPWQARVPNVIPGGRNLPDISFDADPETGIAFYYGGSWDTPDNPLGGTSLSSPLFGAALAAVNQYEGSRAGLAALNLYRFFGARGYHDAQGDTLFHAITIGCNTTDSPGYCANGSYSQATGIGSPDVWNDLLGRARQPSPR